MLPDLSTRFSSRPSFQAVLTHHLFRRMLRRRLNSDQLTAFFVAMEDFGACSRFYHRLPSALRELGHSESAEAVERIAASEESHGPKFERMAIELIYSGPEVSFITARAAWVELKNLVNGDVLRPTFEVMQIFASRHDPGVSHVPNAIGIMLAAQMTVRESIIPGEKLVFLNNPHYQDFTLDHPAMAYLRDHTAADGAETWHAALMQNVLTGEMIEHRDGIEAGFDYACEAIVAWYSAIEAVLFGKR